MTILTAAKHKHNEAKLAEDEKIRRDSKSFAAECFGEFSDQLKETEKVGVFQIPDSTYKLEYDAPSCKALSPKFRFIGKSCNRTQSSIVYVTSLETLGEAIAML